MCGSSARRNYARGVKGEIAATDALFVAGRACDVHERAIGERGTLPAGGIALACNSLTILRKRKFRRKSPGWSHMKPKKTILCVDDNEQSLSIRKVLLETRGYRVVACNNGEEALERFRLGGIDLVLTDLVMPGVDGSRLIEEIKTLSPQTPAMLISGRVKVYERDTLADVFLPKGAYEPAELLERIRLMLVKKRGPKRPLEPKPQAARASAA